MVLVNVYKALMRLARGALSTAFWCLCQKISLYLFTLIKLLHKSSEWSSLVPGPEAKSSSLEITNLALFTISYHLKKDRVRLWELDHKEGRMTNNWCLQTAMLEKTPASPLGSKEIKPVNLRRNQIGIFIWRDWCWSWTSSILVIWCDQQTHWKSPWC